MAKSMQYKKRHLKKNLVFLLRILILCLFVIGVLAPIYWMLVTSLKTEIEIVNVNHITFWPEKLTFGNYQELFKTLKFDIYLKNSIFLTTISSVIVVIISALAGYGLSRYKFKGQTSLLFAFLVTQMIPGVLISIPLYLVYSKIHLVDTYLGLIIIYVIMQLPFCVITMKSFFQRIPNSLDEAARVDGCTRLQALRLIILPILLPGIIAVFVFAFTAVWNDLLIGVIFTSSTSLRTIPVGMKMLVGKYNVQWGQLTAGGIVALIPTVVMFAFIQRYIVSGLTSGAVKG